MGRVMDVLRVLCRPIGIWWGRVVCVKRGIMMLRCLCVGCAIRVVSRALVGGHNTTVPPVLLGISCSLLCVLLRSRAIITTLMESVSISVQISATPPPTSAWGAQITVTHAPTQLSVLPASRATTLCHRQAHVLMLALNSITQIQRTNAKYARALVKRAYKYLGQLYAQAVTHHLCITIRLVLLLAQLVLHCWSIVRVLIVWIPVIVVLGYQQNSVIRAN